MAQITCYDRVTLVFFVSLTYLSVPVIIIINVMFEEGITASIRNVKVNVCNTLARTSRLMFLQTPNSLANWIPADFFPVG